MTATVRCRGCDTEYTPQGLSQHISRTQDPRCQHAPITSRVLAGSSSSHRPAMPPSLDPICTPPLSPVDAQNDDIQMSDGAFVTAYVASIHSVNLIFAQRQVNPHPQKGYMMSRMTLPTSRTQMHMESSRAVIPHHQTLISRLSMTP